LSRVRSATMRFSWPFSRSSSFRRLASSAFMPRTGSASGDRSARRLRDVWPPLRCPPVRPASPCPHHGGDKDSLRWWIHWEGSGQPPRFEAVEGLFRLGIDRPAFKRHVGRRNETADTAGRPTPPSAATRHYARPRAESSRMNAISPTLGPKRNVVQDRQSADKGVDFVNALCLLYH
jgi:hypothetical protein